MSRINQENQESAYMRLERSRSACEQSSSGSMEAGHIMEGLLNMGMQGLSMGMQLGGMLLGLLGSCSGCAGM